MRLVVHECALNTRSDVFIYVYMTQGKGTVEEAAFARVSSSLTTIIHKTNGDDDDTGGNSKNNCD